MHNANEGTWLAANESGDGLGTRSMVADTTIRRKYITSGEYATRMMRSGQEAEKVSCNGRKNVCSEEKVDSAWLVQAGFVALEIHLISSNIIRFFCRLDQTFRGLCGVRNVTAAPPTVLFKVLVGRQVENHRVAVSASSS